MTHDAELTIAHTSDLHLGARAHAAGAHADGEPGVLRAVLDASIEAGARALLLAGDIFDNNRVPARIVEEAAAMLAAAAQVEVVALPGNHDPLTEDSVYFRAPLRALPNLRVLGLHGGAHERIERLELEVWGLAHRAYADMPPLASPGERALRWQVVMAHGHYVRGAHDHHRGWLIHDHDLEANGADYIALGHWDVPQPAGNGANGGAARAYYSGSPEVAKTVNIVRLSGEGIDVRRHPLRLER